MDIIQLQVAFDLLIAKLETLYGIGHCHDFQKELDAVEALIKTAKEEPSVSDDKTSGRQVASKVGKAK